MAPLFMFASVLYASASLADSCIILGTRTISNTCAVCKDVALREMRTHDNRAAGLFTGANHTLRLQPGEKVTLPGTDVWAIDHLAACV